MNELQKEEYTAKAVTELVYNLLLYYNVLKDRDFLSSEQTEKSFYKMLYKQVYEHLLDGNVNIFTSNIDDEQKWYGFDNLFQEFKISENYLPKNLKFMVDYDKFVCRAAWVDKPNQTAYDLANFGFDNEGDIRSYGLEKYIEGLDEMVFVAHKVIEYEKGQNYNNEFNFS